jgi:hypothetical protein
MAMCSLLKLKRSACMRYSDKLSSVVLITGSFAKGAPAIAGRTGSAIGARFLLLLKDMVRTVVYNQ